MSFKGLRPIQYGGREVWPLIEGGNLAGHLIVEAGSLRGGIGQANAAAQA